LLQLTGAFVTVCTAASIAWGQAYPSRTITMIVPYPAGGVTDTTARIVAEGMRPALGQPIIVENVVGGSGTLGNSRVARATPDGYTIGIGQWSSHVSTAALLPVQYDVLKDFEPVSLLTNSPLWIVSRTTFPATDLTELVTWLRANPDKASAASPGVGSAGHICGIYFKNHTGTRFQLVPYRGGAPAMQDIIAGQIDLMCGEASQMLAHVRSGKMKAFAVMAKSRWAAAPDVPTVDEAGIPGLYISFWHGLWVPKGTPSEIIAKLNAAVIQALADPAVRRRFADLGTEIVPREQQTPEALRAHHQAEIDKWWPILKAANITAK